MPHYLFQGAYSSESWKTLIKKPVNRIEAIRPTIRKLGGSIESAWFAFGDYDVVVIIEMPDNVSAAAFALAVGASGSLKSFKTTPLISPTESIAAMKKAASSSYRPPGK
jgi:uncharacterized protein with GYD domain